MAANYYDILNVPKDADEKAISEAYKKMALKWHPDKNLDNVDEAKHRFQQISHAYQVLSDSNKRLKYDRVQCADRCDEDYFYDNDDDGHKFYYDYMRQRMMFQKMFQYFPRKTFYGEDILNYLRNSGSGRNHGSARNGKPEPDAQEDRRNQKHCENVSKEECHIRKVNGKQWMTKTYYENGNKIVVRYEDGELVSKQINDVSQKIR